MSKTFTILIACLPLNLPSSVAATADELAREIIKAESTIAHNARDSTPEELQRTAAANSRLRLQYLMLNDGGVSEEIRICYAIRVIDDKLGLHKIVRSGNQRTTEEEALLTKRLLLAKRLIELEKTKVQRSSAGQTPTRSGSN
jgi:hypothetical protein